MDRWIAAFGVKTHSPYAGRGFPTQAYFGDTHLHTSFFVRCGSVRESIDPGGRRP
jgi:hypothetical protein